MDSKDYKEFQTLLLHLVVESQIEFADAIRSLENIQYTWEVEAAMVKVCCQVAKRFKICQTLDSGVQGSCAINPWQKKLAIDLKSSKKINSHKNLKTEALELLKKGEKSFSQASMKLLSEKILDFSTQLIQGVFTKSLENLWSWFDAFSD